MKVTVIGGKLQGVEASFLAHSLGWKVALIDRNPNAPAKGLSDSFCACDVVKDFSNLCRSIKKADLIIPTLENVAALKSLQKCSKTTGVPLAYDEKAYLITRSKKRSNHFFEKIGIPVPKPWPQCGLPVIVKPSTSSGSRGVVKLSTEKEFFSFLRRNGSSSSAWVVQEYLEGPCYSLEVLGLDDHYEVLQVTELEMDDHYDCKRVLAPAKISESVERELREMTLAIAKALRLQGIMDVEVIQHNGVLKLLEIDARLPSQTPTAVLKSTGINMLNLLGDIFCEHTLPSVQSLNQTKGVVYEHIHVTGNGIEVLGEHIMAEAGPLKKIDDFFGADVALTNFDGLRFPWVATLIITGENLEASWSKRCQVIDNIVKSVQKDFSFSHEMRRSGSSHPL